MIYVTISQSPPETSAQDVEKKKAEPRTPHFLSLNQDSVAALQEQKCGLKYVMFTLSGPSRTLDFSDLSLARFCLKTLPEMMFLKLIPGYYKLFHG